MANQITVFVGCSPPWLCISHQRQLIIFIIFSPMHHAHMTIIIIIATIHYNNPWNWLVNKTIRPGLTSHPPLSLSLSLVISHFLVIMMILCALCLVQTSTILRRFKWIPTVFSIAMITHGGSPFKNKGSSINLIGTGFILINTEYVYMDNLTHRLKYYYLEINFIKKLNGRQEITIRLSCCCTGQYIILSFILRVCD